MLGAPLMLWAITGCSGSGASTVAEVWKELGASVCSLDRTGHRFLEKPRVKTALQKAAGLPVDSQMPVNEIRTLLRDKAFTEPETLYGVNSVLHPKLRRWVASSANSLRSTRGVFVLDAALIFELDLSGYADFTVTVKDTRKRALERLAKRDGISRDSAEGRWRNQMEISEKCLKSNFVINNSGSKDELVNKAELFYSNIITRMEDAKWHTRPEIS
ncbi:dephospho-CoA kinase [Candidatus Fermentibacteria bacterium]|nr:MAG: dephospho-CoA kinase [Candidatus Fermentibacteria bacterium]